MDEEAKLMERVFRQTEIEELILDAMPFLTAPDQTYRATTAFKKLATLTPRLERAKDGWEKIWKRQEGENDV